MVLSNSIATPQTVFHRRLGVNRNNRRIPVPAPGTLISRHIATLTDQNIIVSQSRNLDRVAVSAGTGIDGIARSGTSRLGGGFGIAVLVPGVRITATGTSIHIATLDIVVTQGIHQIVHIAFAAFMVSDSNCRPTVQVKGLSSRITESRGLFA